MTRFWRLLGVRGTPPAAGKKLSHGALFWALQLSGWTAFGLVIFGYLLAGEGVKPAIFDLMVFVATGLLLTGVYRLVYRGWRVRELSLPRIGLGVLFFGIFGVPLWYEPQVFLTRIASIYHPAWVSTVASYTEIPPHVWLFWATVLLGWSFLYFGINDWISLQAERKRAAAAELSAQDARLRALHAQLQPHFLFNTLNSVSALILDERPNDAAAMIAGLGSLLRLSLQSADSTLIPLERELEFLRQYLEIEKTRFGERLKYSFDVSPELVTALIPTLLLQPLVENALRHGILPQQHGGSVLVRAHTTEQTLKLQVVDDGRGWSAPGAKHSGIGLANTARRLEELYGSRGKLAVSRSEGGGVTVDIALPLQWRSEA